MTEPQPAPPEPLYDVDIHAPATEEYVAARRRGLEKLGGVLVGAAWLVAVATAVVLLIFLDALQDSAAELQPRVLTVRWIACACLAIAGVVGTLLLAGAGALLHYVGARDGLEAERRSTGSHPSVDAAPKPL